MQVTVTADLSRGQEIDFCLEYLRAQKHTIGLTLQVHADDEFQTEFWTHAQEYIDLEIERLVG